MAILWAHLVGWSIPLLSHGLGETIGGFALMCLLQHKLVHKWAICQNCLYFLYSISRHFVGKLGGFALKRCPSKSAHRISTVTDSTFSIMYWLGDRQKWTVQSHSAWLDLIAWRKIKPTQPTTRELCKTNWAAAEITSCWLRLGSEWNCDRLSSFFVFYISSCSFSFICSVCHSSICAVCYLSCLLYTVCSMDLNGWW